MTSEELRKNDKLLYLLNFVYYAKDKNLDIEFVRENILEVNEFMIENPDQAESIHKFFAMREILDAMLKIPRSEEEKDGN